MAKIDLATDLKAFYQPGTKQFAIVDVPPLNFLMIDGHGNPNTSPEYADAVQTLYTLAYSLKFSLKKADGTDFRVMPLEGLWWSKDMASFSTGNKDEWDWTMMIAQPELIMAEMVEETRARLAKEKPLPSIPNVRLERYHEGLSVQIMHIGDYASETPILEKMHDVFIPENGLEMTGKHHEIYLSDPRRTAPEKWKIVLRQPVKRVSR